MNKSNTYYYSGKIYWNGVLSYYLEISEQWFLICCVEMTNEFSFSYKKHTLYKLLHTSIHNVYWKIFQQNWFCWLKIQFIQIWYLGNNDSSFSKLSLVSHINVQPICKYDPDPSLALRGRKTCDEPGTSYLLSLDPIKWIRNEVSPPSPQGGGRWIACSSPPIPPTAHCQVPSYANRLLLPPFHLSIRTRLALFKTN